MTESKNTPPQPELELPYEKVGVTILLGKNWDDKKDIPELTEGTEVFLSRDSVMTTLAGGFLYGAGLTDRLLISTGQTKENYPTEAEAMNKTLSHFFTKEEVPEEVRETEEMSIDTAGNAEEVAKILAKEGYKGKIRLITVGRHLERATTLFENYGVHIDESVASEDVLKRLGYDTSRPMLEKFKGQGEEFILRQLLKIDPQGKGLTRKVTSFIRR